MKGYLHKFIFAVFPFCFLYQLHPWENNSRKIRPVSENNFFLGILQTYFYKKFSSDLCFIFYVLVYSIFSCEIFCENNKVHQGIQFLLIARQYATLLGQ